jgi:phage recombination protein Bet
MNAIAQIQPATRGNVASKLAARFGLDENIFMSTIKATVFKNASDAQMAALMVVSDQYGLNPFTKEIYAFPDKNNGIVPVVGVDGWSRIINSHPQFDGMSFEESNESCKCIIFRKDRAHPISVTEYMAECKREAGPWKSHPRRMLRHKAMIQCARLAFGFAGIYDPDEAERIIEATGGDEPRVIATVEPQTKPFYPQDQFDTNFPAWEKLIKAGKKTADALIAMVESKAPLTVDQKQIIKDIKVENAQ